MKAEILMAVFNGEAYLAEQIDSILRQDTGNWHLTISDDGSTDRSREIIQTYTCRYPEKISQVFSGQRFGNARDHFFWLMKNCDADYILFCDQDDVWHTDKVRKTLEALYRTEAEFGKSMPALVFTDQTVVDQNRQMIAPSMMELQQQDPDVKDYRALLIKNVVTGCTVGINRALAARANCCAAPQQTIMHDWWLALVAARFGKLVYLDESTMEYRQHGKNSVGAKDVRRMKYLVEKLTHPKELRKKMEEKKIQATVFSNSFQDVLPAEEKLLLKEFSEERIPLGCKLRFLEYVTSPARKADFIYRW